MIRTYVEAQFCALHKEPFGHALHGHDWWVRAEFQSADPPRPFAEYQKRLDGLCSCLDHHEIGMVVTEGSATNEGVATWFLNRMRAGGCVRVEVWRYERGRKFGAVAE